MVMKNKLYIHKGRTNILPVSLGLDISTDTFQSQIREEKDSTSPLIAEWAITFLTDGTDGELIFTLDDAITASITQSKGYMDVKRIKGGEPFNLFSVPIEVYFRKTITL